MTGNHAPEGKIICPECRGVGVIMQVYDLPPAMNLPNHPPDPPCSRCNGEGVVDAPEGE
jgi:hypothetical protein